MDEPPADPAADQATMDVNELSPDDCAALSDLLGVLAYGALTAAIRMAGDADLAPSLSVKSTMVGLAAGEYARYGAFVARMHELEIDPEAAMQPFVAPLTAYHSRTRPKSWLEGLVKAYVGEGIANDFYREVGRFVDPQTRSVIEHGLDDEHESELVVGVVRRAMRTDPQVGGRLALWGRRLVGEALSQAQAVAVERDALTNLLIGHGADLAELGRMFNRLTEEHRVRMGRLGLTA